VSIPENVAISAETILSSLRACQPFNDVGEEVNIEFLKTARKEARKILRMVESVPVKL